ncbi:Oxygen tolerance [Ferrimonas sediminum]|uniref:Oxygen tolerance n=1 Tax=Ferrimonas sediminum TaxID=718193 RepID=A0A1G8LAD0_9GAMM|nr:BatD family protein [Ferrimonas sediminum]SDI52648.1 Oxygen tolerance [Ferrimonas sediminum]
MVNRLVLLMMLCISPACWSYSSLTASIDANPVVANQSFVLTVIADDDVDANALDTTVLENQFTVVRNNVSRSTQIINFNTRRETRWQLVLIPKSTGTLTIPALMADGLQSQPITLKVVADGAKAGQLATVFMKAGLSEHEVWLGQPVDYWVKLYLATELQRGQLSEPQLANASVVQLGQDRNGNEVVNGRRYRVIERHYLITPQQAGTLTVKGSDFSGDILKPGRSNDLFARSLSTPVQVMGSPVTLTVKQPPASFTEPWLVANAVSLSEQWNPEQLTVEVGDPITRIINLTAVGTSEAALPTLALDYPKGLKSYPDKAERGDDHQGKEIVARLQQSTAIVASSAGEYTLPEIRVAWWNSKLNRKEYATLAARTLTVLPGEATAAPAPPPSQPEQAQPAQPEESVLWRYLSMLLAIALVLTFIWGYRRQPAATAPAAAPRLQSEADSGFVQAAQNNDLQRALKLLPAHLDGIRGPTPSLSQVRTLFPELAPELDQLQQAQFGRQQQPVQVLQLLKLVTALQKKVQQNQQHLPELNPKA